MKLNKLMYIITVACKVVKMCYWVFNILKHNVSIYIFTARRSYASAVLEVVILSVCPSVCHTRAFWLIQRTYRRYFYTI